MNFAIEAILPYVLLYKYWAIFGVTLLAAFAFPVPPGTMLMAAAAFASQGYFSFPLVLFSGILGNIVGDNLGYWVARAYGKKVMYKLGLRKKLESERYKKIEEKMRRRPGFIIFITRFEIFANLAVNIISGVAQVEYKKYLRFVVLGEICQVTLYAGIGYMVGDNWTAISALVSRSLIFILALIALFIILFWKRIKHWFQ
ncbi:MAG: DedA family protein [Candidatus Pacebacteria bacterium]|nr:DedA family protein [Candidatus Paceibacterota bacterium]